MLCLMLNMLIIIFYFLFPLSHVVDKWKAYEKAMEDLHKAIIHELNNAFF